jgi:hypothetical protein
VKQVVNTIILDTNIVLKGNSFNSNTKKTNHGNITVSHTLKYYKNQPVLLELQIFCYIKRYLINWELSLAAGGGGGG